MKRNYYAYNLITLEVMISSKRINVRGRGWVFSPKHDQIRNLIAHCRATGVTV